MHILQVILMPAGEHRHLCYQGAAGGLPPEDLVLSGALQPVSEGENPLHMYVMLVRLFPVLVQML